MNAKVRKLLDSAIQSDGIEELFETGKHIDVDIFSNEYMARIEKIPMPNTKIKVLQRLLSYAIEEFKRVNKIKSIEFVERMKELLKPIIIEGKTKHLQMRFLMMWQISLRI